jgi:gluconolactonase
MFGHGGRLLHRGAGVNLFDSLAVDGDGYVCVATISNGGITVISPDGNSVEHAALPDPIVTNICFGGDDLRTAYVTLSATGKLVSFEWPRAGLKLPFQA